MYRRIWTLLIASTSILYADILVIDEHAGTGGHGALFKVNPTTGFRTVLSDFGNAAQAPAGDPLGAGASSVAVNNSGQIFVTDTLAGRGSAGILFKVDPISGFRTIISDFGNSAQGPVAPNPKGLAIDVSNILIVTPQGIYRVDSATGFRTLVKSFSGSVLADAANIVIDTASGDILITVSSATNQTCNFALISVSPANGVTTCVSDFGNIAQGTLGQRPAGLAISASRSVFVVDEDAGTDRRGLLFSVDRTTGSRTVLSDFANTAQGVLGTDPTGVSIDNHGAVFVVDPSFDGGHGLLFSVDPATGFRTVLSDFSNAAQGPLGIDPTGMAITSAVSTAPVDLTITQIEVTQGIQDLSSAPFASAPLVQDKTTYVRVYPGVDIVDTRFSAQLRGFREAVELPGSPLKPVYPFVTAHTAGANHGALNDSFNFWLPPSWLSGSVSLQAEFNPDRAIPETNYGNNVLTVSRTFTRKAPVCVVMIPVRTHGSRYDVYTPGFWGVINRFATLWPVPDVWVYYQSNDIAELQFRLGIPPWELGPYELDEEAHLLPPELADRDKVIFSLFLRSSLTDEPDECGRASANVHYVGMVSPDSITGSTEGYAAFWDYLSWVKMEGPVTPAFYLPNAGGVMAQELSHNYNGILGSSARWGHVNCGNPTSPINNDYPYQTPGPGPKRGIGQALGTIAGFDPISMMYIGPLDADDYMSYCAPRWVSDYTWRGMLDNIKTINSGQQATARTTPAPADSDEVLVVAGSVIPSATIAKFEYAFRVQPGIISSQNLANAQLRQQLSGNPSAPYALELLDKTGVVLSSQIFDSRESPSGIEVEAQGHFYLIIPFNANTARIRVTHSGRELGSLAVSAHAPTVRLIKPSGGEVVSDLLTIQWAGNDEDNDTLFYSVQYSANLGNTWQSLVTLTPESSSVVDMTNVPGSNQRSLIRVIANDGVNTSVAVSNPFSVRLHAPSPHIDNPLGGAIFLVNTQIIVNGGAIDAEDGPLQDASLIWSVNGRVFGSGKSASLIGLPAGIYDISLTATDTSASSSVAHVTITVVDNVPVANPDVYRIPEQVPLAVNAPGVLGNDYVPEGRSPTAVLASTVTHGSLTLNRDGSFVYTPFANYKGVDAFAYRTYDGNSYSNVVSVSLFTALPPIVPIPGDLNVDGHVDCADLAIVRAALGKRLGQPGFDPRADTNNDGVVDVKDLAFVAQKLPAGTSCP